MKRNGVFDEFQGVSSGDETLCQVLDITSQKKNDFRKRIKDAKMSSFSSDFQTLIKHLFTCMFCWLYLQVILATNIAESSITVPDIKYGECTLTPQSYSSATV